MNIDKLEHRLAEECPGEARKVGPDYPGGTQVYVILDGKVYDIDDAELDDDGKVYLRLVE